MGVKNCSRVDCDSIMCDTYISGIGYICHDCMKEFESKSTIATEKEHRINLNEFLNTPKGKYPETIISVSEFFKQNIERYNST